VPWKSSSSIQNTDLDPDFIPFRLAVAPVSNVSVARYLFVVAAFEVVDGSGDKGMGGGLAGCPDQEISIGPQSRPLSVTGDRLLAGDNDL